MSGFIGDKTTDPYAFIQWKGTDVCMDFHCKCGAHCHFDGDFAYVVKCPHCEAIWEMPCYVTPRKTNKKTYQGDIDMAKELEPDEEYSDEVTGADGITRDVPHAVTQP